jgi:hypothetical protein
MKLFSEEFVDACAEHIYDHVFENPTEQEVTERCHDMMRAYAAYDCVSRLRDLTGPNYERR